MSDDNYYDYNRMMQLEIHDQVMMKRGKQLDPETQLSAAVIIEKLHEDMGTAEMFLYNSIEEVKETSG